MSKTDNSKSKAPDALVNKKARFNFELGEIFEAGMVLTGSEVKSLREKKGNLTDAFAKVKRGEVFLENLQIPKYKNKGYSEHIEIRPRKLLLHKKEISLMEKAIKEKGLVLVAVKCYFKDNRRFKVQIAIAKPKKLYDKREDLQKKDAKIEIERAMKGRLRT
ncbi:SsrA-binding protein SmpB [Leptospira sp. GIMC2001]|uniref:SsrA-binding protein SmpB n=1 Tax=Leptospira sp. GIMC2001 TaxID=1513297 RepID=UPI00234ACE8C|nr:SsrA-binding protein SmpB [Leptospira sp. GIMC2001]WCL48380.1 SsrA-binding protein SmpB [Leptospira sp. GIMC2001]